MEINPDEWRELYDLRDDLDIEDRMLMRKLIHYTEFLERTIREARRALSRAKLKELKKED